MQCIRGSARGWVVWSRPVLAVLAVSVVLFCRVPSPVAAKSKPEGKGSSRCFAGTYLVDEGSGTTSLWTFTADGNVVATSSTQQIFNFTNLQGSWKRTGKNELTALLLDFSFEEDGTLLNIARIDLVQRFLDKKCRTTEGAFSLRFFEVGEDPLSPDGQESFEDTFQGRRIVVESPD